MLAKEDQMAVTDADLFDLLDVLRRLGARIGGDAILIQLAKDHFKKWSDDEFWGVAAEAEKRGLLEVRRGGYVVPTLDGDRMVEGPRP